MIAIAMVYVTAFTAVYGTAARMLERVAWLDGRPMRRAWTGPLIFTVFVAAITFVSVIFPDVEPAPPRSIVTQPTTPQPAVVPATSSATNVSSRVDTGPALRPSRGSVVSWLRANTLRITTDSRLSDWDLALLRLWGILSGAWVLVLSMSAFRLARARRRWREVDVDGSRIFVSDQTGPAVVGLLTSHVVVPRWIVDSPPAERELVIAHEMEHVKAGDSRLLFASTFLLVAMPWNIALWWITRRLRFAIEADCDARVLRAHPDRRAYGTLLLDVSERTIAGPVPVAALAEARWMLERRLIALTEPQPKRTMKRKLAYQIAGLTIAVSACVIPRPDPVIQTDESASSSRVGAPARGAGTLDVSYPPANVSVRIENRSYEDGEFVRTRIGNGERTAEGVSPRPTQAGTPDSNATGLTSIGTYSNATAVQDCGRSIKAQGAGLAPWGMGGGSATWGEYPREAGVQGHETMRARLMAEARGSYPSVFEGSGNALQIVAFLFDPSVNVIDRVTCYRPPVVENEWLHPKLLVPALFPGIDTTLVTGSGIQSLNTRATEFAPGNRVDVIAVWGVVGKR